MGECIFLFVLHLGTYFSALEWRVPILKETLLYHIRKYSVVSVICNTWPLLLYIELYSTKTLCFYSLWHSRYYGSLLLGTLIHVQDMQILFYLPGPSWLKVPPKPNKKKKGLIRSCVPSFFFITLLSSLHYFFFFIFFISEISFIFLKIFLDLLKITTFRFSLKITV